MNQQAWDAAMFLSMVSRVDMECAVIDHGGFLTGGWWGLEPLAQREILGNLQKAGGLWGFLEA